MAFREHRTAAKERSDSGVAPARRTPSAQHASGAPPSGYRFTRFDVVAAREGGAPGAVVQRATHPAIRQWEQGHAYGSNAAAYALQVQQAREQQARLAEQQRQQQLAEQQRQEQLAQQQAAQAAQASAAGGGAAGASAGELAPSPLLASLLRLHAQQG